jgi:exodeoxyribonuclease VII small subunit
MRDEKIEDPKQFEASLGELEAIVDRLEQGDLTLEESLSAFERGIRLTRSCQQALEQAEQRVRILTERSTTAEPEPFNPERDPGRPDA